MYLYIYDSFLSHQKYSAFLTALERRVTDLGINGKIVRLSVLKNSKELVSDAVRNGVTTVIAVGDDQTFAKLINSVADLDVTLGLIPAEKSAMGAMLGLPLRESACDVIAARIVKKMDLGKINSNYFLHAVTISNAPVQLTCDGYSLAPLTEHHTITIANIGDPKSTVASNPLDGTLEAIITPIQSGWISKKELQPTVLPFTKITIQSTGEEPVPIIADGQMLLKTPAVIEVCPHKLKIIVGSNRSFD